MEMERLDQLSAVLDTMQQALKCNICLDMINNPVTTKCGHSFCRDCIHNVLKGPRNSSLCPLCMNSITKRSLGKNAKITGLVAAVHNVIDSIKRDCSFEVTPKKYRPRQRQRSGVAPEDDDSENEENDEPRRGTRKRGTTALYNPEIPIPKPRAKSPKQRILASNGGQELSLHAGGAQGNEGEVSNKNRPTTSTFITKGHITLSPTKQEALEKQSGPVMAKGKSPRPGLAVKMKATAVRKKGVVKKDVRPTKTYGKNGKDEVLSEDSEIGFGDEQKRGVVVKKDDRSTKTYGKNGKDEVLSENSEIGFGDEVKRGVVVAKKNQSTKTYGKKDEVLSEDSEMVFNEEVPVSKRGVVVAKKNQSTKTYGKNVKDDEILSASQHSDMVFPGEELPALKKGASDCLSEKLGREKPSEKVAKWLNNSSKIGFRIGASNSTSSTPDTFSSTPSTSKTSDKSEIFPKMASQSIKSLQSSIKPVPSVSKSEVLNAKSNTSKLLTGKHTDPYIKSLPSTSKSEVLNDGSNTSKVLTGKQTDPNIKSLPSTSKSEVLNAESNTSQFLTGEQTDPYTFLSSQNTPMKQVIKRGRGRGKTRGGTRGRGNERGIAEGRGNERGIVEGRGRGNERGIVEGRGNERGIVEGRGRGNERGIAEGRGNERGIVEGRGRGNERGIAEGRGNERGIAEGRGNERRIAEGRGNERGIAEGRGNERGMVEGRGRVRGKGRGTRASTFINLNPSDTVIGGLGEHFSTGNSFLKQSTPIVKGNKPKNVDISVIKPDFSTDLAGNKAKNVDISGNKAKNVDISGNKAKNVDISGNKAKNVDISGNKAKNVDISTNLAGNKAKNVDISVIRPDISTNLAGKKHNSKPGITMENSSRKKVNSNIIIRHDYDTDDIEDNYDIPDSCPVNTKDDFDVLVSDAKENGLTSTSQESLSEDEEDTEAAVLFITPAQTLAQLTNAQREEFDEEDNISENTENGSGNEVNKKGNGRNKRENGNKKENEGNRRENERNKRENVGKRKENEGNKKENERNKRENVGNRRENEGNIRNKKENEENEGKMKENGVNKKPALSRKENTKEKQMKTEGGGTEQENPKKRLRKDENDDEERKRVKKDGDNKRESDNESIYSNSSKLSVTKKRKTKAEKAREEAEAISLLFKSVEEHQLSTVSVAEEERSKIEKARVRDEALKGEITLINLTMDNTELNKTVNKTLNKALNETWSSTVEGENAATNKTLNKTVNETLNKTVNEALNKTVNEAVNKTLNETSSTVEGENAATNKTLNKTVNKALNETGSSSVEGENAANDQTMPPPRAPGNKRRVRFIPGASETSEGDKGDNTPCNKSSMSPKINIEGRHNVRYASELKVKLVDVSKAIPTPISVKDMKSPGWSHVAGARKALKVREKTLNITGGGQRALNDSRTEGGTSMHSFGITSSLETNVTIDEATQEFDVEHLSTSETKKDRVLKLRKIVSELKRKEGEEANEEEEEYDRTNRTKNKENGQNRTKNKENGQNRGPKNIEMTENGKKTENGPKKGNRNKDRTENGQNKGNRNIENGQNTENKTGPEMPSLLPDTEPFPVDDIEIEIDRIRTNSSCDSGKGAQEFSKTNKGAQESSKSSKGAQESSKLGGKGAQESSKTSDKGASETLMVRKLSDTNSVSSERSKNKSQKQNSGALKGVVAAPQNSADSIDATRDAETLETGSAHIDKIDKQSDISEKMESDMREQFITERRRTRYSIEERQSTAEFGDGYSGDNIETGTKLDKIGGNSDKNREDRMETRTKPYGNSDKIDGNSDKMETRTKIYGNSDKNREGNMETGAKLYGNSDKIDGNSDKMETLTKIWNKNKSLEDENMEDWMKYEEKLTSSGIESERRLSIVLTDVGENENDWPKMCTPYPRIEKVKRRRESEERRREREERREERRESEEKRREREERREERRESEERRREREENRNKREEDNEESGEENENRREKSENRREKSEKRGEWMEKRREGNEKRRKENEESGDGNKNRRETENINETAEPSTQTKKRKRQKSTNKQGIKTNPNKEELDRIEMTDDGTTDEDAISTISLTRSYSNRPKNYNQSFSSSFSTISTGSHVGQSSSRVPATDPDSRDDGKSQVVPFKSVGPLCSPGCEVAGNNAKTVEASSGGMRDLCLHAVPCEVYQVLLKYMALMASQRHQHKDCCGCHNKKTNVENIPTDFNNKTSENKTTAFNKTSENKTIDFNKTSENKTRDQNIPKYYNKTSENKTSDEYIPINFNKTSENKTIAFNKTSDENKPSENVDILSRGQVENIKVKIERDEERTGREKGEKMRMRIEEEGRIREMEGVITEEEPMELGTDEEIIPDSEVIPSSCATQDILSALPLPSTDSSPTTSELTRSNGETIKSIAETVKSRIIPRRIPESRAKLSARGKVDEEGRMPELKARLNVQEKVEDSAKNIAETVKSRVILSRMPDLNAKLSVRGKFDEGDVDKNIAESVKSRRMPESKARLNVAEIDDPRLNAAENDDDRICIQSEEILLDKKGLSVMRDTDDEDRGSQMSGSLLANLDERMLTRNRKYMSEKTDKGEMASSIKPEKCERRVNQRLRDKAMKEIEENEITEKQKTREIPQLQKINAEEMNKQRELQRDEEMKKQKRDKRQRIETEKMDKERGDKRQRIETEGIDKAQRIETEGIDKQRELQKIDEEMKKQKRDRTQKIDIEEIDKQRRERAQRIDTVMDNEGDKQKIKEKNQIQTEADVEKENVKNTSNVKQISRQLRLRRDPSQQVLSQVITDTQNSNLKIDGGIQATYSNLKTDGELLKNPQQKQGKKELSLAIGSDSGSESESNLSSVSNSAKRKYRRICKPAASSSSSDSDSEVISSSWKRRTKAIPSSDPSLYASQKNTLDQNLHELDSEEMRDLERMDLKVWEVLGHPDKDLRKLDDDNESLSSAVTIEFSQKDVDNRGMDFEDDPPLVTLSSTLDDEIPGTADAMRNVDIDMEIIRKGREKASSENTTKKINTVSNMRDNVNMDSKYTEDLFKTAEFKSQAAVKTRSSQTTSKDLSTIKTSSKESNTLKTSSSDKTRESSTLKTSSLEDIRDSKSVARSETRSETTEPYYETDASMRTGSVGPTLSVTTRKMFKKVDKSLSKAESLLDDDNDMFENYCTPQDDVESSQSDEEKDRPMLDQKNYRPLLEMDANNRPMVESVDSNGRPMLEMDSNVRPMLEMDSNNRPMLEMDQNDRPLLEMNSNNRPMVEMNSKNGRPILEIVDANVRPTLERVGSKDTISETDSDNDTELETASHSSAFSSSQSEAISTQKKKQVENEVEKLRARVRELEAEMKHKGNSPDSKRDSLDNKGNSPDSKRDSLDIKRDSMDSKVDSMDSKVNSQDIIGETELEIPGMIDSDEEIISSSLPDLTMSREHSLKSDEKTTKTSLSNQKSSKTSNSDEKTPKTSHSIEKSTLKTSLSDQKSSKTSHSIEKSTKTSNSNEQMPKTSHSIEKSTLKTSLSDQKSSKTLNSNEKNPQTSSTSQEPSIPSHSEAPSPKIASQMSPRILPQREGRYRTHSQPEIVCTGLNLSEMKKVLEMVEKVGEGELTFKKSFTENTTHLLVKSDEDRLAQRTLKYLFGVATGCWVLDIKWVIDSLVAKRIMAEVDYEVFDITGEPGPRRGRISPNMLFADFEFVLKPPIGDITCDQLKELLELCGGEVKDCPDNLSVNPNITKLIITDTEGDNTDIDVTEYNHLLIGHDWVLECVGLYSHICIRPYIIGNPTPDQIRSSHLPMKLMQETQEL